MHDPAIPVPTLKIRDATHLESRGPEVDMALWILTAVSSLSLSLRLYCKSYKHKDLWLDDWILILSWVRAAKFLVLIPNTDSHFQDPSACQLYRDHTQC